MPVISVRDIDNVTICPDCKNLSFYLRFYRDLGTGEKNNYHRYCQSCGLLKYEKEKD